MNHLSPATQVMIGRIVGVLGVCFFFAFGIAATFFSREITSRLWGDGPVFPMNYIFPFEFEDSVLMGKVVGALSLIVSVGLAFLMLSQ